VPRSTKDLIEEQLFESRCDLFSELSVVFMDTTTLYFEGRGGDTLGEKGKSKDYRPYLNQPPEFESGETPHEPHDTRHARNASARDPCDHP
jgi:hypothetical protein